MFKEARFKLTAFYLLIIMAISIFFSVVIFRGSTAELDRIERFERYRSPILDEIRDSVTRRLFILNLLILGVSGASGYFLAGKTLDPIRKNMEDQKDFVSSASHELRTPLTSLTSEIEVALRDKKMTIKDARKLLESNLEDVKKMSKLSNYLLRLNRFEDIENHLSMAKIDLKDVVLGAIGKLDVHLDLEKSEVVANADGVRELISILVDNAIKYSPGKEDEIVVRTRPGGILEIEDHGSGISEIDIPHIFEKFYRGDKSRSHDGYGLGLSIAKSIVDAHEGKIAVKSKIGKGTTFTVCL